MNAMMCISSTDFHTTNLVDVNWAITVIIKLCLSPKLLMTLLFLHQRSYV